MLPDVFELTCAQLTSQTHLIHIYVLIHAIYHILTDAQVFNSDEKQLTLIIRQTQPEFLRENLPAESTGTTLR